MKGTGPSGIASATEGGRWWWKVANRAALLLAALGLSALACNAPQITDLVGPLGAADNPSLDRVAEAGRQLLDRWEDRLAFYALMAALDRGYSADQVIDSAAELAPDGTIPGVGPAGPPLGLLSPTGPGGEGPPGEAAIGAAARIVPAPRRQSETPADQYVEDVGSWLSEVWQAGQEAIQEQERDQVYGEMDDESLEESVAFLTLVLAGRGYSGDQIIDALLFASVAKQAGTFGCLHIQGPDGAPIPPANEEIAAVDGICPPLGAEADEPGQGSDRLVIESAEAFDGFCHDTIVNLSGGGQYQVCEYQVSWELAYYGIGVPAQVSCHAEGLGRRQGDEPGGFFGLLPNEQLTEPSGTWSDAYEERGEYPAPGVYQDRIVCEVRAGADGEGDLLASSQTDVEVDISEVRVID